MEIKIVEEFDSYICKMRANVGVLKYLIQLHPSTETQENTIWSI